MKVTVIPKRPIPAILPKNKWVDTEMELDLNKNEIKHCMQYGVVKDMSGVVIDERYIRDLKVVIETAQKIEIKEPEITTTVETDSEPIIIDMSKEELPEVATSGYLEVIESFPVTPINEESIIEVEPSYPETSKEYFILEQVSAKKEDEHIVLEVKMNTNSKLEGDLYGLFTVISGARPTPFEFKVGDEWFKFNNKFANFTTIENEAKFTFRLTPRGENEFTYRVSIKTGNDVLVKLEETLNPLEL